MTAVQVVNAFTLPRIAARPSKTTLPAGVPLQKPIAQRSLQSLAFNPTIDSGIFRGPSQLPFVRPDVPPESDEGAKGRRASRLADGVAAEGNFRAKPSFRSALEQVSYVTNNKLWDASKQQTGQQSRTQRPRLGIFGL